MAPNARASASDTSDTGSIITVGGQSTSSAINSIAGTPPTSVSGSSVTGAATPNMTSYTTMPPRSMRQRNSKKEYNIKKLVGTARHTRRKYLGLPTTAELEAQKTQAQAEALLAASVPAMDSSTDDEHSQSSNLDEQLQASAQVTEEQETTANDVSMLNGTPEDQQQALSTPTQTISQAIAANTVTTDSTSRPLRKRGNRPVYNEQVLAGTDIHGRVGYLDEEGLKKRIEYNASKCMKASPRKSKKPMGTLGKVSSFAKGLVRSIKRKIGEGEDSEASEDETPMPLKKKARQSASANFDPDVAKVPALGKAAAYDKKYEVEGFFKNTPPRLPWTKELQNTNGSKKKAGSKSLKSPVSRFDGTCDESDEADESEDEESDDSANDEADDDGEDNDTVPEDNSLVPSERVIMWSNSKILPPPQGSWGRALSIENAQGYFIENKSMPQTFRDFALPHIVAAPLENESVPKNYHELNENRLSADAKQRFKKAKAELGLQELSYCRCHLDKPHPSNCSDSCINRATSVECNDGNCRRGDHCENRAFAKFDKRMAGLGHGHSPNLFTTGVQVFQTQHCGHGIKAIREFEEGDLIMEYCGEMITQKEQDERMENQYKGKYDHFYFMSMSASIVGLDKMVIDATKRGSVARFVNHSCEPNCQVLHVVVDMKPRVGLFAARKIYAGEELTYDYNFSPFGEDKQKCHCGSGICRGFLGPKPNMKDELMMRKKEAERRAAEEEERLAKEKAEQEATMTKMKRKITELCHGITNAADLPEQPPEKKLRGWKGWVPIEVVENERRLKESSQTLSARDLRLAARAKAATANSLAASKSSTQKSSGQKSPARQSRSIPETPAPMSSGPKSPARRSSTISKAPTPLRPASSTSTMTEKKTISIVRKMRQTTLAFGPVS